MKALAPSSKLVPSATEEKDKWIFIHVWINCFFYMNTRLCYTGDINITFLVNTKQSIRKHWKNNHNHTKSMNIYNLNSRILTLINRRFQCQNPHLIKWCHFTLIKFFVQHPGHAHINTAADFLSGNNSVKTFIRCGRAVYLEDGSKCKYTNSVRMSCNKHVFKRKSNPFKQTLSKCQNAHPNSFLTVKITITCPNIFITRNILPHF